MFQRLLPKEFNFYGYFEQHIEVTIQATDELLKITQEGTDIDGTIKKIKELEKEADAITHKCTDALHITFITPIERSSIFRLIKQLDNITDQVYAAVFRFSLYGISEARPEAAALSSIIAESLKEIQDALVGLRTIKNSDYIKKKCIAVRELENRADEVFRTALFNLFKENQPIEIIKWKEIFERLERAINSCENVSDIIEGIVIEAT
jgi:uncharacterized protein